MTRISNEVWSKLFDSRFTSAEFSARLAIPEMCDRLFVGVDPDGNRHLLILLYPTEEELRDRQTRGLSVETRLLIVPGEEEKRYLDLYCTDFTGMEVLDFIGGEIAEKFVNTSDEASLVVKKVLTKWRRFWGVLPLHVLTRNEQIGLIAELYFLCNWCIGALTPNDAVSGWRGPTGARHDFEWSSTSIEVKATLSSRGPVHRINGFDQLSPPKNGHLKLYSLTLREEQSGQLTLPSIVTSCLSRLEGEPEVQMEFEKLLSQAGYLPGYEDEYAKLKVNIGQQGLYKVEDDFPRITHNMFADGIPPGIEGAEYEINLSGFGHLLLTRDASQVSHDWFL